MCHDEQETRILVFLENYWYFVQTLVNISIVFDNLLKFLTILVIYWEELVVSFKSTGSIMKNIDSRLKP